MSDEATTEKKVQRALTREGIGIEDGLPLEVGDGGPDDLRKGIQMLMDMEAIRQLKHAYFRCIDTANFEELANNGFYNLLSVKRINGTQSPADTKPPSPGSRRARLPGTWSGTPS